MDTVEAEAPNPESEKKPVTSNASIKYKKFIPVGLLAIVLIFIAFFFLGRIMGQPNKTSVVTSPSPTVTANPSQAVSPTVSNPKSVTSTPTVAPTVTSTPTPTSAPVGNFGGHWVANFGTIEITQNGANVTGTYHNGFDGNDGTVAGIVSGNHLTGTYQKGGSGSISWTLSSSGDTFDGNWDGSNKWCGARSGKAFPDGCAFAGHWNINIPSYCPAGNPASVMQLTQTDTSVSGTYCNGTLNGSIHYSGGGVLVSGTYNSGAGNLTFYLNGYNSTQFQGNYASGVGTWCGWRDGSAAPSPCKK